jgi:hypothetical protein
MTGRFPLAEERSRKRIEEMTVPEITEVRLRMQREAEQLLILEKPLKAKEEAALKRDDP